MMPATPSPDRSTATARATFTDYTGTAAPQSSGRPASRGFNTAAAGTIFFDPTGLCRPARRPSNTARSTVLPKRDAHRGHPFFSFSAAAACASCDGRVRPALRLRRSGACPEQRRSRDCPSERTPVDVLVTVATMRDARGFTLIELLIVIAIVGVLSAIGDGTLPERARAGGGSLGRGDRCRRSTRRSSPSRRPAATSAMRRPLRPRRRPMPTTGQAFLSPDLGGRSPYQERLHVTSWAGPSSPTTGSPAPGCTPVVDLPGDGGSRSARACRASASSRPTRIGSSYEDEVTFTDNMPETGAPGHGREVK